MQVLNVGPLLFLCQRSEKEKKILELALQAYNY